MRGEREGGAWGMRGLTLFRTDSLLSLPEGIDWTRICIPDFTLPMVVPREVLCVHIFIHVCVCVIHELNSKQMEYCKATISCVLPSLNIGKCL